MSKQSESGTLTYIAFNDNPYIYKDQNGRQDLYEIEYTGKHKHKHTPVYITTSKKECYDNYIQLTQTAIIRVMTTEGFVNTNLAISKRMLKILTDFGYV